MDREPECGSVQVTLVLRGAVGIEEAAQLQADVVGMAPSAREVTVDCGDADRLHCAALQVLLSMQSALSKREGSVRVHNANASIRQLAGMAGLSGLFDPTATLHTASNHGD